MEGSSAARGMQLSGASLKGFDRYNQNYASGEYQNAFNRNQTELNNLWQLSGMGMNAASGQNLALGGLGQAMGQGYANQGAIGAANAMAPYNAAMSGINTGMSVYNLQNMYNQPSGGGDRSFLNPVTTGGMDLSLYGG